MSDTQKYPEPAYSIYNKYLPARHFRVDNAGFRQFLEVISKDYNHKVDLLEFIYHLDNRSFDQDDIEWIKANEETSLAIIYLFATQATWGYKHFEHPVHVREYITGEQYNKEAVDEPRDSVERIMMAIAVRRHTHTMKNFNFFKASDMYVLVNKLIEGSTFAQTNHLGGKKIGAVISGVVRHATKSKGDLSKLYEVVTELRQAGDVKRLLLLANSLRCPPVAIIDTNHVWTGELDGTDLLDLTPEQFAAAFNHVENQGAMLLSLGMKEAGIRTLKSGRLLSAANTIKNLFAVTQKVKMEKQVQLSNGSPQYQQPNSERTMITMQDLTEYATSSGLQPKFRVGHPRVIELVQFLNQASISLSVATALADKLNNPDNTENFTKATHYAIHNPDVMKTIIELFAAEHSHRHASSLAAVGVNEIYQLFISPGQKPTSPGKDSKMKEVINIHGMDPQEIMKVLQEKFPGISASFTCTDKPTLEDDIRELLKEASESSGKNPGSLVEFTSCLIERWTAGILAHELQHVHQSGDSWESFNAGIALGVIITLEQKKVVPDEVETAPADNKEEKLAAIQKTYLDNVMTQIIRTSNEANAAATWRSVKDQVGEEVLYKYFACVDSIHGTTPEYRAGILKHKYTKLREQSAPQLVQPTMMHGTLPKDHAGPKQGMVRGSQQHRQFLQELENMIDSIVSNRRPFDGILRGCANPQCSCQAK